MGGNADSVKAWLRSRHIPVLGEWVEACVEWIHEEHQGTTFSGSQLCKMVYEQWLDSDLTEIATPCLPAGVKQAKKTQLKGNFALQVNCIQDISTPAYAQLTKLQGRENENTLVTATQATQGKFEPHSSRMLMLSLTDGQETIQAMEYKLLSSLTCDLNPGAKIMLSGDMQCRLGVILLTPAHVKVLGGEVEALKDVNSQEKVLARAIGVTPPEMPAGSNTPQQGTTTNTATTTPATNATNPAGQTTTANNISTARSQTINSNYNNQPTQHGLSRNNSAKTSVKQEPYANTYSQHEWGQGSARSTQDIKPVHRPNHNQGRSIESQDTQPVDQGGWSQGHSRSHQGQTRKTTGLSRSNQIMRPPQGRSIESQDTQPVDRLGQDQIRSNCGYSSSAQGHQGSIQNAKPIDHQDFQDAFMDDDEEGLDELMLEELENMERETNKAQKEPSFQDWDAGDIDEEELLAMEWETSTKNPKGQLQQKQSTRVQPTHGAQGNKDFTSARAASSVNQSLPDRSGLHSKISKPSGSSNMSPSFASNAVPLFKKEIKPLGGSGTTQGFQRTVSPEIYPVKLSRTQLDDESSFGRSESSNGSRTPKDFQRTVSPEFHLVNSSRTQLDRESSFGKGEGSSTSKTQMKVGVQLPVASKVAVATRFIKTEPISQQRQRDSMDGSEVNTKAIASSVGPAGKDFVSAQSLVKSEDEESACKRMRFDSGPKTTRPFIYLVNKADELERKEACQFNIKGFIMTLVSSLSHNPTWSLAAKINDGTMSLDVDISDKVLSEMIGFTVSEMLEMKASMKKCDKEKANEIKETIKQGIGRCQQTLIDLSCIMTIEVKPEYSRPLLIAVRQPTMDDCNTLRCCLDECLPSASR